MMESEDVILEVGGVSRSGRVRKKSSKLMDFESPDEVEAKLKKKEMSTSAKRKAHMKPRKLEQEIIQHFSGQNLEEVDEGFPGEEEMSSKKPIKLKIPKPEMQPMDTEELFSNPESSFNPRQSKEMYYQQQENTSADSDVGEEAYPPDDDLEDEYAEEEEEDDDLEDNDDDDDEDYEGQLVVDEKAPTQSLYMMEKNRRKKAMVGGRMVAMPKPCRKDKGKTRFTAYMMWSKEVRKELSKQYPDMDFTTMARRLSELWGTVPNSEREIWKRKAKREAAKNMGSVKHEAPLMQASRKFINKKMNINRPPIRRSPPTSPMRPVQAQVHASPPPVTSDTSPTSSSSRQLDTGMFKVTGTAPIDIAAHLKLLGESFLVIGEKLQEHEGQIAVSGSLSVLLDSFLCAVGPLYCMINQVEGLQIDEALMKSILDNISYLIPGLV